MSCLQSSLAGCKAGNHRSPVSTAAAKEELQKLGYSVAVLELSLVKVDVMPWFVAMAEDWLAYRVSNMDFVSSYSNFHIIDLVSQAYKYRIDEVAAAVQEALAGDADESEWDPQAKRARVDTEGSENPYAAPGPSSSSAPRPQPTPRQPTHPPPPQLHAQRSEWSSTLPPPPPAHDLGDDLLDEESWQAIEEHRIDDQAVLVVKRLAYRSLDAAKKVLRKLDTKTDIAKPSQFISKAANNAIEKWDRNTAV